jgi:hypothetical protein
MRVPQPRRSRSSSARAGVVALAVFGVLLSLLSPAGPASAASSKGCTGGGFSLVGAGGNVLAAPGFSGTIPASALSTGVLAKGKYIEFTIVPASLGVLNWTLTGAANPLDLTGGQRIVVFASKTPDNRGLTLTSPLSADLTSGGLVVSRTGTGLSMKIQALDCASGGIFQIEPSRGDGTATVFTHTLSPDTFYFDNPNFRKLVGTTVPFVTDTGAIVQLPVPTRVNFASDRAPLLVGRDSPQVATRINQCTTNIASHCGGVSVWSVASGGRMGAVMGEDAVELSPAATTCTHQCQAQDRIRGRAVVLGFPSPVPAASRLTPRLP